MNDNVSGPRVRAGTVAETEPACSGAGSRTVSGRRGPTDPGVTRPRKAGPTGILLSDLRSIAEVAGPPTALRFLAAVLTNIPAVLRTGTLTAADRAMAGRTYRFHPLDFHQITLPGDAFAGAREIYCRKVYFALPGYAPVAGETVVDLGANQGLFSVLAARAGANVIAVEAQRGIEATFMRHAENNGVTHRIRLLHALVGSSTGVFADESARIRAGHWGGEVEKLTFREVLDRAGADRVDLVKMDVEGSEFALFTEPDWMDSVQRIVMEVHTAFGDPLALTAQLHRHGFETTLLSNELRTVDDLGTTLSGYIYAKREPNTCALNTTNYPSLRFPD